MAVVSGGELHLNSYVVNNIVPIGPRGSGYFAVAHPTTYMDYNTHSMVVYQMDDSGVLSLIAAEHIPEGMALDSLCQTDEWRWVQVSPSSSSSGNYLLGWSFDPEAQTLSRVDGSPPYPTMGRARSFGGGVYDPHTQTGVFTHDCWPLNVSADLTPEVARFRWRDGDDVPVIEQVARYSDVAAGYQLSWSSNSNDFTCPVPLGGGAFEVTVKSGTIWRIVRFDAATLTFQTHAEFDLDIGQYSFDVGYYTDYNGGSAWLENYVQNDTPPSSIIIDEVNLLTGQWDTRTTGLQGGYYAVPSISPDGKPGEAIGFVMATDDGTNEYPPSIQRGPCFAFGEGVVDVKDTNNHLRYIHPMADPVAPGRDIYPQSTQGQLRIETASHSWHGVAFEQYSTIDDTANGGFARNEGSFIVFFGWPVSRFEFDGMGTGPTTRRMRFGRV